jgi:hypothetical protein
MATSRSFDDFLRGPSASHAFKQVALEAVPFHSRRSLRPAVLNGLSVDILKGEIGDAVLGLSAYVWAEVLQNDRVEFNVDESGTFEASWPATWWEHVKQRWFPRWALAHWPVRLETKRETWRVKKSQTHVFKTVALLPEFKYEAPPGCGTAYVLRTSVDRTA